MTPRLPVLLLTLAAPLAAAQNRPPEVPGQERVRFTERSPLSSLEATTERHRWPRARGRKQRYELQEETFTLYLPPKLEESEPGDYGLVVWMSPARWGVLPPAYQPVFDRRRLAVVAPDAGNERPDPVRVGLALDAVQGVLARRDLDPARVYAMGFSGGGNMACQLVWHYPEVFRGGLYMSGCLYHRDVPAPDGELWRGGIHPPPPARLEQVRERSRHVWLCGERDDHTLAQTRAVLRLAREDGFLHTELLEVPRLGHGLPQPKHLAAALAFLEQRPAAEDAEPPGDEEER